jgi:hypothetical protein
MTLDQQLAALGRIGLPQANIDVVLRYTGSGMSTRPAQGDNHAQGLLPGADSFSLPGTAPVLDTSGAGSRSGVWA